jgi:SAM-dependent methyltransferase
MKRALAKRLMCLICCYCPLDLESPELQIDVESGRLLCPSCGETYPIVSGIPRFVRGETYADNFGLQWNRFRTTQLDSHSGTSITRERFLAQTACKPDMRNARVLDAGCGAGRFAEIALSLGADLVTLDLSTAVDACKENLGGATPLSLIQADLLKIPFPQGTFDLVYCFGVLQHTPDPRAAVRALTGQVKAGGWLAIDIYRIPLYPLGRLAPKYLLRPLTRRIPPDKLFDMVRRWTPSLLRVSTAIGRIPYLGGFVRKALPIANYRDVYPLSEDQLVEWGILDTFDQLSPRYDFPQTDATVRAWFPSDTFSNVRVFVRGHIVAWGKVRAT